jgi:hypothetical protein
MSSVHNGWELKHDTQLKGYVIDTIIFGVLIIGSALNQGAILILAAILFYKVLLKSQANTFNIFLLLIPNLGTVFIPHLPVPLLNLLIPIAVFRIIILKDIKIDKKFMFIALIFISYEWSHIFLYNVKNLLTLFSWTITIFYISLFISNNKLINNDHKLSIKYFISGLFISSFYGVFYSYLKSGLFFNFNRSNLADRFIGAAGDPNYYSVYILIGLFSLLQFLNQKSKVITKFFIIFIFLLLLLFGFMSLSRMFFIVFCFVFFIYFLCVIGFKRKYSSHRKFIISFIIVSLIIFSVFSAEIINNIALTLSRFTNYGNDLTNLTSNRNLIADYILNFLISNPVFLIFGVGIQSYGERVGNMVYAHNIFLELLAAWGIIGLILFFGFIIILMMKVRSNSFLQKENKISNSVNFIGWLPLICLTIGYMSINGIEVESFYILLLFVTKNIYYRDLKTNKLV